MQETKKKIDKTQRLITKVPAFQDLLRLQKSLESAMSMLNSLADEGDTIQRASELYDQIEEMQDLADEILLNEE
jgi:hypothetical protein